MNKTRVLFFFDMHKPPFLLPPPPSLYPFEWMPIVTLSVNLRAIFTSFAILNKHALYSLVLQTTISR